MYDNSATILAAGMGAAAFGGHRLHSGTANPGEGRIAERGETAPGALADLPLTSVGVVTLVSVGLLLVVLGIALMLAARRTGDDHRAS